MALAMGKWAGLRRRWRHLLAAVPLALVVGIAPPDAMADDLEPDKGQEHTLVAQVSSTDDSTDDNFVSIIDQFSDVEDPKQWTTENSEEPVDTANNTSSHLEPTPPLEPAEHQYPIVSYIFIGIMTIGIITFIIYQYTVLMKIRKLEKDIEEISQNRITTLKSPITRVTGIITTIAAAITIIHFFKTEFQSDSQKPALQQVMLQEDTEQPHYHPQQRPVPGDRLAAILSKVPSPTPDNIELTDRTLSKFHSHSIPMDQRII